jgi:hypothetical protein
MLNAVLSSIGLIGPRLRAGERQTPEQLLLASGYLEAPESVTVQDLEAWFSANPQHVLAWGMYSVESRCEWFGILCIAPTPEAGWHIAYTAADGSLDRMERYESGAEACAIFVKAYVERLAKDVQHAG